MANDKVRKLQLSLNDAIPFSIYGVVTTLPVYKLCLALNPLLNISLRSDNPLIVSIDNQTEISFPRFSDLSQAPNSWISIIANKSDNNRLMKKMNNIDYLILHFDENDEDNGDNSMLQQIRDSGIVTGIFSISRTIIDRQLSDLLIPLH